MLCSTPTALQRGAWPSLSLRRGGNSARILRAAAAASGNDKGDDASTSLSRSIPLDPADDWRGKAKPVQPGSSYPAKEHCSQCGLCDTYYVAHVKEACAFLGEGMSKAYSLEPSVHGRNRNLSGDELQLGVTLDSFYARAIPSIEGAQWTGVVTSIAIAMLETKAVDAVICVQSDPKDRLAPLPVVARSKEEVLASRGVKPSLSPNLSVLATVEALGPEIRSLLFIGVGCQVQALRSVSKHLSLDKLFVLGTNCTDNGPREGLRTFLDAASGSPQTAVHYEFMQDYTVHIKHDETNKDLYEKIPYFSLPANELTDVIAPSCYACFDYTNSLADVVVSYMGVPYSGGRMSEHRQHVVVRNERGKEMLAALEKYHLSLSSSSSSSSAAAAAATSCSSALQRTPTSSSRGLIPFLLNRESLVIQTVEADDEAKLGRGPEPAPVAVGNVIASILNFLGPKGIEFAKYSVDYHYLRNWLHVQRHFGSKEKAERHVPEFAKVIVERYDREVTEGRVRRRLSLPGSEAAGKPKGGPRRRRPAP